MNKDDFLYYMVDVDMVREEYGVVETVKSDLVRSKSLTKAKNFSKSCEKQPGSSVL